MKLLLIVPRKNRHERDFFDFRFVASFVGMKPGYWGIPLAIPTIAAMTPRDVDVRIIDENIEEIPFDAEADLVGITVMTLQARRAYEIAHAFRSRGCRVILGGIHPSVLPEEAAAHADSVFVGEAEGRWGEVIDDARRGALKARYAPEPDAPRPELSSSPIPRAELTRHTAYVANLLQTSRGCPFDCDFCSVQDFLGSRMRYKSPSQVTGEIEHLYATAVHDRTIKQLFLTDDNLVGNPARARELLTGALIPMHRKHKLNGWTCQCSVNVAKDEEMLSLLAEAGCGRIFIGFESLSAESLAGLGKGINRSIDYGTAIRRIRAHGMDVISSFILGSDGDDVGSFRRLVDFIDENALVDNLINILVPFPGTKLFRRMEQEGRILTRDWSQYDLGHVVFRPKRMSPQELEEGYIWVHEEVYRLRRMYRKLKEHRWKVGRNRMPLGLKLKFVARMLTYLTPRDWDRNWFIGRTIPDIFDSRLDMNVSLILNCMDHQDFARHLGRLRARRATELEAGCR